MAVILFKRFKAVQWLMVCSLCLLTACCSWLVAFSSHPYYMSVTEIEYKAPEKELQIACKMFTDDLEDALKNENGKKVNLLDDAQKIANKQLLAHYISRHLKVIVNGKAVVLEMLGFENKEDGLWIFLTGKNGLPIKSANVFNDLLCKVRDAQINIVHFKNKGDTKSYRLNLSYPQHTFRW